MIGRLVSVGFFTALSRVAGFVRDVLMAAILGAGPMSDAFMVAFRLPNNFRAIFAEGAFNAAFLPRYKGNLKKFLDSTTRTLNASWSAHLEHDLDDIVAVVRTL